MRYLIRVVTQYSRISHGLTAVGVLLAACLALFAAAPAPADDFEEEVRIGKEAAAQAAKELKFVTDEAAVKRVETIGASIAKVANELEVEPKYGSSKIAKFDYAFKISDDKDVNAFSLPAGFVYINKGLLDYVQSDDELAAVIAHEVAHVSHHHLMQLLKAQQKQLLGMAAVILAGSAAGASDIGVLATGAELVATAKMSSYGQKAEADADRTAVAYLAAAQFNPVGMLTFIERLARDEARKPAVDWGIFRTHPLSRSRAKEIARELESRGIKINRRLVTAYLRVQVKPVEDSAAIWVGETEVARLANSGGESALTRAERAAAKLETVLLAGARLNEVRIGGGGQYVVVRDQVIIAPTEDDASLAGASIREVVSNAAGALRKALWKELVDEAY